MRLYELWFLPNNTASGTFLHKSGAVRSVDIYRWGAGVAVTDQIRDTGQHVLQSYFQIGSSGSPSYIQIFLLIAFLEGRLIRNIIITLCIIYIIIIDINNIAVINNKYGRLQGLIFF